MYTNNKRSPGSLFKRAVLEDNTFVFKLNDNIGPNVNGE